MSVLPSQTPVTDESRGCGATVYINLDQASCLSLFLAAITSLKVKIFNIGLTWSRLTTGTK